MSQQYRDRTPSRTPPANMSSRPATVTPSARRNPVAAATTTTTTTTPTTTTPSVKNKPTPVPHATVGTTPTATAVPPPTAKRKPVTREEMLLPSKKDMDTIKSMVASASKPATSARPTPVSRRVTESVPMKAMRSRSPSPNVPTEARKTSEPPTPSESKTPSSASITPRASRLPLRSSASKTSASVDLSSKTSVTTKTKVAKLPQFKAKMAAKSPSPPPLPPSPTPVSSSTPPSPKILPALLKSKTKLPSAPTTPAPSVRQLKEPSLVSVITSAVTAGLTAPVAALVRKRSSGLREPLAKNKTSDASTAETNCSRESCASIAVKSKHDLQRRSLDQGPHSPTETSQTTRIAVTRSNSKTVLFEMDLPKATSVGMVSGRHTATKGMPVMTPASPTGSPTKLSNTSLPGKRLSKLSTEVEGSKLPSPKKKTPSEEERLRLKQLPPPQTQPSFTGSEKSHRSIPAKSAPTSKEKSMGERSSAEKHAALEKKQRTSYSQDQLQQAKMQLRQQHLLQLQQAAKQTELKSKTSVKKSTSKVGIDSNKLKQSSVSSKDDIAPKQHTKRSSLSLVDEPPVRTKSKHSSLSVNQSGKQQSKGALSLKDKNKATDESLQLKSSVKSNTVRKSSSKVLKPVGDHRSEDKALNSKDVSETENTATDPDIVLVMSPPNTDADDDTQSDLRSEDVCLATDLVEVADKDNTVDGFIHDNNLMPNSGTDQIVTAEEILSQNVGDLLANKGKLSGLVVTKTVEELVMTKTVEELVVTKTVEELVEEKESAQVAESERCVKLQSCNQSVMLDDESQLAPSVCEEQLEEGKDIKAIQTPRPATKEKEVVATPTPNVPLVDTVLAFSGMSSAMEQMEQIKAWPLDTEMQANVEENRLLGFSKDIPAELVKLSAIPSDKTKDLTRETTKESFEQSLDTLSDLSTQYRDIPPTIITENMLLTSETSVATILSGISTVKKDELLESTNMQFKDKTMHVNDNEGNVLLEVPKPCLENDSKTQQEITLLAEESSKKLILSPTSDLLQDPSMPCEDKLMDRVADLQPFEKSSGVINLGPASTEISIKNSLKGPTPSPSGQSNGWSPILFDGNKDQDVSPSPTYIKTAVLPGPLRIKEDIIISSATSFATPPPSAVNVHATLPRGYSPPYQSSVQSLGSSLPPSQSPSTQQSYDGGTTPTSVPSSRASPVSVSSPEADVKVSFGLNTPYQHLIQAQRRVENELYFSSGKTTVNDRKLTSPTDKMHSDIDSQAVGSKLIVEIMKPSETQIQGPARVSPIHKLLQGHYNDFKRIEDANENLCFKDRSPRVALSTESKNNTQNPPRYLTDLTLSGPRGVASAPQRNGDIAVFKSEEFGNVKSEMSPEPRQMFQTSTDSFIGVVTQEIVRPPPDIEIPLNDTPKKLIVSKKSGDELSLEKQLELAMSFSASAEKKSLEVDKTENRASAFTPVAKNTQLETTGLKSAQQETESGIVSPNIFGFGVAKDSMALGSDTLNADNSVPILTQDMQTAMDNEKSKMSLEDESVTKLPFHVEDNKKFDVEVEKISIKAAFGDYTRPTTDELKLDLTGLQTEQDDNEERIDHSKLEQIDQKSPVTFGEIRNQLMQRNLFGQSTTALTTMHKDILSALFAALSAGSLTPEEMSELSLALDASSPGSVGNTAELNNYQKQHTPIETQPIRHETITSLSNKKQGLMLALTNALSIGVMSTELHCVMAALSRSHSLEQQSLAHRDPKSTMSLDNAARPNLKNITSEKSDAEYSPKDSTNEISPMELLTGTSRDNLTLGDESLDGTLPDLLSEEMLLKILSSKDSSEGIKSSKESSADSSGHEDLSTPRIQDLSTPRTQDLSTPRTQDLSTPRTQDSNIFSVDQKLNLVESTSALPANGNYSDEASVINQQLVSALSSALSVGKMSHKLQDVLTVLSLKSDENQASTVGNVLDSFANMLSVLTQNPPRPKQSEEEISSIISAEKALLIAKDAIYNQPTGEDDVKSVETISLNAKEVTAVQEIVKKVADKKSIENTLLMAGDSSDIQETDDMSENSNAEDDQEPKSSISDGSSREDNMRSSIISIQEKVLSEVIDLPTTQTNVLNALTASLAVPLQTALTIISADGSQQAESGTDDLLSSVTSLDITEKPSSDNLALSITSMSNMLVTEMSKSQLDLASIENDVKQVGSPKDMSLTETADVATSLKALSVLTAHAQETSVAKDVSQTQTKAQKSPDYSSLTLSPEQKEIVNALSLNSQNALSKLHQQELTPSAQAGDASSISVTKPSELGSENKDTLAFRQGSQQPNAISAFSVSNKNIQQTELPQTAPDAQALIEIDSEDKSILSEKQQDVLSALSVALDAGKLTKELHDALSSLCVGKNSPLQQDALSALSSLLSPNQSSKQLPFDIREISTAYDTNQEKVSAETVGEENVWHQVKPSSRPASESMHAPQGREDDQSEKQHVGQPLFSVEEETSPAFGQAIVGTDQKEKMENKLIATKPLKKSDKPNDAFTLANYDIFLQNRLELSSTEEDNVIITTIRDINELPTLEDKDRSTTSSVSGSELLTPFLLSPFVFSPATSRDTSSSLQTTETLPTLDHGRLVAQLTAFDQTPDSEQSLSADASLSPTGSLASPFPDADDTAAMPTLKTGGVFKTWKSTGKQIRIENATDEDLSHKTDAVQKTSSKENRMPTSVKTEDNEMDGNIQSWSMTSSVAESLTTAPASWSTVYQRFGAIHNPDEVQAQVHYHPPEPGTQDQTMIFGAQPTNQQENRREFLTISNWKDEDNSFPSEHYYLNVADASGRPYQTSFIQQSIPTDVGLNGPHYTQSTNVQLSSKKSGNVQSILTQSDSKNGLQTAVPPVTKLRADATPFVHVPSSKPMPINVVVPQSSSNTQVPANNMWQNSNVTNQPTQAQLQAQANLRQQQQIISNLMTQELLVPYVYDRSQYLQNSANYQTVNETNNTRQQIFGNWEYQSQQETQSSFGSDNDSILEPVAITPKLDESGYWSSNDSRTISNNNQIVFDISAPSDGELPTSKDSATSSVRLASTQITEDGRSVALGSSVPVEHFFSLVDVTLTPPFVPNISNDLLNVTVNETAANDSNVPARPLMSGSYMPHNESIDSQLDGTEIPPPRNEHLFAQMKDSGGNAISSTLTLGKDYTGEIGVVGTLLNYETDQSSIQDDANRKRHVSDADVESGPCQSFGEMSWRPQGMYRERYQQEREQKSVKQNVDLSLHGIKEMEWPCTDIQRVSAEEFYNEQDGIAVWSGNTEVSDDGKMVRMSVEDFLQQVNDPSQHGKHEFFTSDELNFSDESRMSAEDFFQVCRLKASQIPEVTWHAGDTGFPQVPTLTLSYDVGSDLSVPTIDDSYGHFQQVSNQYVDPYGTLQGATTTYHPIPQTVNEVFQMNTQQNFWQGEQQLPEKTIAVGGRTSYQQSTDAFDSLSIGGPSKLMLDNETTMTSLDDRKHNLMHEEMRRLSAEQFFHNKFTEGSPFQLAFLRSGPMSVSHDDLRRQSAEQFFQNGGHRFAQPSDVNYFTKGYRQSAEQLYQKPQKMVKSSLTDDSGRMVLPDDSFQIPEVNVYLTSNDSYLFQHVTDGNAFMNDPQALQHDDSYRQSAEQFYRTGELRQQMAAYSQQSISSDDSYRISAEQYFQKPTRLPLSKAEEKFNKLLERNKEGISDARSEDVSVISIGTVDERSQIRATGSNDTITSEDDQSAGLSRLSMQKDDNGVDGHSSLRGQEFLDLDIHLEPSWETVGLKTHVQVSDRFLPSTQTQIRDGLTERQTQTDQVLVISLASGFFDEETIKISDIEARLKKLVEVELTTILAQVKPDSLMLVAESSVVELLNRFREMNSQPSLVELGSTSSIPRPSPSPSRPDIVNDDEAIITVVAAANLQHSAAYRLERFLENFNYPQPVENFMSVHSTVEGQAFQSEMSIGEIVNVIGIVEGSPVSELPSEMLTIVTMEEGIQTDESFLTKKKNFVVVTASESESDESDDAVTELTEEKEEVVGVLEDISEEDANYISVDTSECEEADEETINNIISSDKSSDKTSDKTSDKASDKDEYDKKLDKGLDLMSDDIILAVEKAVNDCKGKSEEDVRCLDVTANCDNSDISSTDNAMLQDIDVVEVNSSLPIDIVDNYISDTPVETENSNVTPTEVVKHAMDKGETTPREDDNRQIPWSAMGKKETKRKKLLLLKGKAPPKLEISDVDDADLEGLIANKQIPIDELLERTSDDDADEEDEALAAITLYKGRKLDLLSSEESDESDKKLSFEPETSMSISSVHAFQIATPVSSTITIPEYEDDNESVSQQQLAVPKRDSDSSDGWQSQQNEHVTGFCLIEQPALLTRERIRAIRKRFDRQQRMMEENCSRLKDLIRFEEILAANTQWHKVSTSPPPRHDSASDNNSSPRRTPTPSPRHRSFLSPKDWANTKVHPEEPNTLKIDDEKKNIDENLQPTLYLRLPNQPSSNNLPTTSSSPLASPRNNQSPNSQNEDVIARESNMCLATASEESNPPWSTSAAKSPVSWESLSTSRKTPDATSLRKSRTPSPVPRRRFTSQSPSDKSPIPSPRGFQRSPSRTQNVERPPSPMPRTKTPDVKDGKYAFNYIINDNWPPTHIPRTSPQSRTKQDEGDDDLSSISLNQLQPEAILSRSKSSQWESNPALSIEKDDDENTRGTQHPSIEINLNLDPIGPKLLALPPADGAKDAKSLDQLVEDELSQLAIPQESAPFLVPPLVSPSTSPSPPIMQMIPEVTSATETDSIPMTRSESTQLTIPEGTAVMIPEGTPVTLNYQLTIPSMTSPIPPITSTIPKINPLKLTKDQLLNPKFLLELLTPPSMLHPKPKDKKSPPPRQWRIPSPLPLHWLLPQSTSQRQTQSGSPPQIVSHLPPIPPNQNRHSPPCASWTLSGSSNDMWQLTLPSLQEQLQPRQPLQPPLIDTVLRNQSPMNIGNDSPTWHPPSPTPLPEGAVTPAPLAMTVNVEDEPRTRSPSPWTLHPALSPPIVERLLQTSSIIAQQPTSPSAIDNRLPSPPMTDIRQPSSPIVDHRPPPSPSIDRHQSSPLAERKLSPPNTVCTCGKNTCRKNQALPDNLTSSAEDIPPAHVDRSSSLSRRVLSGRRSSVPQQNRGSRNLLLDRRSPSPTHISSCPLATDFCTACNQQSPTSRTQLNAQRTTSRHQLTVQKSTSRQLLTARPSVSRNSNEHCCAMGLRHQEPDRRPPSPRPARQQQQRTQSYDRCSSPYNPQATCPTCLRPPSPPSPPPSPVCGCRSRSPRSTSTYSTSPPSPPRMLSPANSADFNDFNKLYTFVINDEESEESDDDVQAMSPDDILQNQLLLADPGLSDEDDADAIAIALQEETPDSQPVFYNQRHQYHQMKHGSQVYRQPIHIQMHTLGSMSGLAERIAFSRTLSPTRYGREVSGGRSAPIRRLPAIEGINSDSDDDGLVDLETIQVPIPPPRVLGVNPFYGLYPFARF